MMRQFRRNPKHREADDVRSQRSQEAYGQKDGQQDDGASKEDGQKVQQKEGD